MEQLAIGTFIVFAIIYATSMFIGIDLRKMSGWLVILGGFLCGFIFGFFREGITLGLQIGTMYAFVIVFSSAMVRSQRQHFQELGFTWVARHEKDSRLSFLVRVIKKLLRQD